MLDIIINRNCVYQTAYHVIWCTKYRKNILCGKIAQSIEKILNDICINKNWIVISKEIQPDHIHIFLSIPPAIAVSDSVKILKGITARLLFLYFPEIKKQLWGGNLWSPSYYVGTAGNVSAETIKKYIERAEHITKRR